MKTLKLTQKVKDKMQRHAAATYPNECCGFFYGSENNDRVIDVAIDIENSQEGDQSRRFEISPEDYMKGEKKSEKLGKTLLGVYHSHPDHPAKPSEHDLKQAMPFFSYIIISVENGEPVDLKSWQLNEEGSFEEEEVKVE